MQITGKLSRIGFACCALLAAPQDAARAEPPEAPAAQQSPPGPPSVARRFQQFLRDAGATSQSAVEGRDEPATIEFLSAVATVVESADGTAIGLHAGITSVQRSDGSYEPAYLALTQSGVLVPVLANGKIAPATELYFASDDCTGAPYLRGSRGNPGYLPVPGSVFRVPRSNGLHFAPPGQPRTSVRARSRHELSSAGVLACRSETQDLQLFETRAVFPNEPGAVYAFDAPVRLRLPTLRPPEQQERAGRRRGSNIPDETMRRIQEALAEELERRRVVECAAGCPEANVGDGSCDAFCNNARCANDGGDCDGLSREEVAEQRQSMCAQGCLRVDVGDGFCDVACNVAECNWDADDCAVQPE